jgi:hypothetical protein
MRASGRARYLTARRPALAIKMITLRYLNTLIALVILITLIRLAPASA